MFQQLVCKMLMEIGKLYSLEPDDIMSRGMGQNGVDVMLSPAARKVFGQLACECKNVEALNVATTFKEHQDKYPNQTVLLFHKRKKVEPLVTMTMAHFMTLLANQVRVSFVS